MLLQVMHRRRDGQRRHLGVPERHDLHLPHPPTRASHTPNHAGASQHCEQPCRR
jgi:hypothetical protein